MADFTTNYNLKKPFQNEYYNVDDFNDNADILDAVLKEISDTAVKAKNYYVLIAAADSANAYKAAADYVCDGTDDNEEMSAALTYNDNKGKTVMFAPGTYYVSGFRTNADNVTFAGIGKVKFVLSARIDTAGKNLKIKNIEFEHTADYSSNALILLNGWSGDMADGVWVDGCTFNVADEDVHIFDSAVTPQPAKNCIRLTNSTLICACEEYDLIYPSNFGTVRAIVTGNLALSTTYNGPVNVKIDATKYSSYNQFAVAGNINFTYIERT